jgi:hypothetical protein
MVWCLYRYLVHVYMVSRRAMVPIHCPPEVRIKEEDEQIFKFNFKIILYILSSLLVFPLGSN